MLCHPPALPFATNLPSEVVEVKVRVWYPVVLGPLNDLISGAGAPQMAAQPSQLKTTELPAAEQTVSAGINRAYRIFGPNLAAFFEAVRADIKTGEHKGVQMVLPLMKSK